MNGFLTYVPVILMGVWNTLILSTAGFLLATLLGLLMAFIEVFSPKPISITVDWVTRVLRGVPLLLALLLVFYGLPRVGIALPNIASAIIGITIVDSGYQAQLFRGAIEGVGERQLEAAYSIGLSKWAAFRYIIAPQAFRAALPGWLNEFTIVLKDSSIAYAIGVTELFTQAVHVAQVVLDYLQPLILVSIVYFSICYPLSIISERARRKLLAMGVAAV
ncbi:MAG: amino acid ABC transporter permease [Sulfolobales archaeon]|nr:amino acid ABC transporter permease [Sulfolobales archaeon]MCX8198442.1 amino acid ABC transporter permease [Sulfolobales archaeon]MDW8169516.1 amino acid ABC transporter permease [Desulfurococcaceae archaeon]